MISRTVRTRQAKADEESRALDISSLIDVSFLLLIYFLITSTLDPKEADLNLTMPRSEGKVGMESPVMPTPRISVTAAGVVSLQDEVLDTDPEMRELVHLEDRLATYRDAYRVFDATRTPPIELAVDDFTSGQRLIDVMNCLAGLEINNVIFVDFTSNF